MMEGGLEASAEFELRTISFFYEKGYAYLSSDYQPFGEFGKANYKNGARDGYYYNGGSWMRAYSHCPQNLYFTCAPTSVLRGPSTSSSPLPMVFWLRQ